MEYELYHHGILGMHWGIRRFQNKDGSLTAAGRKRYSAEEKHDYDGYGMLGNKWSKKPSYEDQREALENEINENVRNYSRYLEDSKGYSQMAKYDLQDAREELKDAKNSLNKSKAKEGSLRRRYLESLVRDAEKQVEALKQERVRAIQENKKIQRQVDSFIKASEMIKTSDISNEEVTKYLKKHKLQ